jgi:hypothetical protein
MSATARTVSPIALRHDEGESLWWHRDSRPARHSFLNSGRHAPGAPVRRPGALRRLQLGLTNRCH